MRTVKIRGSGRQRPLGVSLLILAFGLQQAGPAGGAENGSVAAAARRGDLTAVLAGIAAGEDVNARAADGSTALLWAVYQSDLEMVQALLAAGAAVDAANNYGVTPLLQASSTGDTPVIEALLDGGADLKLTHPDGETPLMAAARTGRVDAVAMLLARGADPNAADSFQEQTALMWAAADGHLEVVDLLLNAGADPNAQARVSVLTERSVNADYPSGGFTALMWAARNGYADLARRLVEGGADLDLANGDGATATMIAIVNDWFDLAADLVELGAGVDDGSLYQAVEMRDATTDWYARDGSKLREDHPNDLTALDLIELLLDRGADPNAAFTGQMHSYSMCCDTKANASPFYRAAVAADVEALKLLLDHGADVEWTPPEVEGGGPRGNANAGHTPVMVAMNGGRGVPLSAGPGYSREGPPPFREQSNREPADAVRLLLAAGANPDVAAPDGKAALHQAVESRKLDVIKALAEGGATLDLPDGDGKTALHMAENPPPEVDAGPFGPPRNRGDATPEEIAVALRELMQAAGLAVEPAPARTDEGLTASQ